MKKPYKTLKDTRISHYWHKGWWQKIFISFWLVLLLLTTCMYGIAQWYRYSQRDQAIQFGVSFIPDYAQSLGVDPQATMDALIRIHVQQFRLVSYWSDIESSPGTYDFSQLDWQFKKAEASHAKVSLAIGLRQPRWPECHMPAWASQQPASQWQPELMKFMKTTLERYQHSPSLQSYQLENEYFLKGFGQCTNFDRSRLITEYSLVKNTDPQHSVIISRSNNGLGIPIGEPKPDEYAISIYKRVWDAGITKRYFEYPIPAWYYAFLAGVQKMHDGRNMIIHELQAEAWAPNYKSITDTSISEQNKSLNATRLHGRFEYAQATGMKQAYMWGSEYWYYRLKVLHDPSLWNEATQEFAAHQ